MANLLVHAEDAREPVWRPHLLLTLGYRFLTEGQRRTAFSTLKAEPAADPGRPVDSALSGKLRQLLNVVRSDVQQAPAVALTRVVRLLPAGTGLEDVDVAVLDRAAVIVGLGLLAKVNLGRFALL